jgi:hypothetical protein
MPQSPFEPRLPLLQRVEVLGSQQTIALATRWHGKPSPSADESIRNILIAKDPEVGQHRLGYHVVNCCGWLATVVAGRWVRFCCRFGQRRRVFDLVHLLCPRPLPRNS